MTRQTSGRAAAELLAVQVQTLRSPLLSVPWRGQAPLTARRSLQTGLARTRGIAWTAGHLSCLRRSQVLRKPATSSESLPPHSAGTPEILHLPGALGPSLSLACAAGSSQGGGPLPPRGGRGETKRETTLVMILRKFERRLRSATMSR